MGGVFHFSLATYKDLVFNKKDQPHTFGTKRPSLEQRYYKVYNQENVDVISLKRTGVDTFTETGIEMHNGEEHQFVVVILATGFDYITGGSLPNRYIRIVYRGVANAGKGPVTQPNRYPTERHFYQRPPGPTTVSLKCTRSQLHAE